MTGECALLPPQWTDAWRVPSRSRLRIPRWAQPDMPPNSWTGSMAGELYADSVHYKHRHRPIYWRSFKPQVFAA